MEIEILDNLDIDAIYNKQAELSACQDAYEQGIDIEGFSTQGNQMCSNCEVLYINGIKTHEHRCPTAYKDETRSCAWCGSDFSPESKYQKFCSEDCQDCYN